MKDPRLCRSSRSVVTPLSRNNLAMHDTSIPLDYSAWSVAGLGPALSAGRRDSAVSEEVVIASGGAC